MCTTQLVIDPLPLYESGFFSFTWGTCTELRACSLSWRAVLFWFAVYKSWVTYCVMFCDCASSARICWIACCRSWSCWAGDSWGEFGALGFILWFLYFPLYDFLSDLLENKYPTRRYRHPSAFRGTFFVEIAQLEAEISLKMLKKTLTREDQLQKAFRYEDGL